MNKYWWVKVKQVNFGFEKKNYKIYKLKVQPISLDAIMHLLDCDIPELFSHVSSFFIMTSESQFCCLLFLTPFSLQSLFRSNFPSHEALPEYSVNILYFFCRFY